MSERPLDTLRVAELRDAFSDSGLPFRVDIIDWASVKEPFREIIRKDYETLQIPVHGDFAKEYVRLDQVADILSGGTPSKSNSDFWQGDIPWISAKDLKIDRLHDAEDHISKRGLNTGSKLAPLGSTLVLVRGMTLLSDVPVCYAERDLAFNQDIKALIPHSENVPEYLYYSVVAAKPFLKEMVELAGHGTGRLPTDRISGFEIRVPPRSEQQAIVNILSVLDDKIELNRRTNETLESIARVIFKSWFVDFSERSRPEEWSQGKTTALIEFNPSERLQAGQEAPYIEMADLPENGPLHSAPRRRTFSSGTKFRNGDTLLARITPCLENGKTALVHGLANDEVGWGSTEFVVMRAKPPVPKSFVYLLARDNGFRDHAIQSMTGTSGRQRVQTSSLLDWEFVLRPAEVLIAFGKLVDPIFEKIVHRDGESSSLSAIRDTLLPKLISGEIRVKDAERLVAEHV